MRVTVQVGAFAVLTRASSRALAARQAAAHCSKAVALTAIL